MLGKKFYLHLELAPGHIKISCLITQLTLPESEIDQSSQLILIRVKICVYIQYTDTEALQCLHPSLR